MCTVVVAGENELRVPEDVTDLKSFRRWVYSDDFSREFKLERRVGRLGHAAYELKVR